MGTTAPRPSPTPPGLRRLRVILTIFFALDGFIFAGWVVRIPAIKDRTGASAGDLGLALLGVSVGAVITMTLTGRLCRRFGTHPVTVACGALLSLSVALPPLTHSAPALGAVLLVFGAAYGGINVAFNSAAVDLVAALRRPIMPSFHAAFSLGGMAGAGLGGLIAGSLSPTRHLLGLTVIGLLVTAVAGRALLRIEPPAPAEAREARDSRDGRDARNIRGPRDTRDSRDSRPGTNSPPIPDSTCTSTPDSTCAPAPNGTRTPDSTPRRPTPRTRRLVLVFGLIALCTAFGEGALADWGALHLEQDLAAHPGVAAAGYSCFALAMTIGRLSGTTLLERLGQTPILVTGGATAAAGMLLGALAPTVWLALLGFAVTGLGLANIFPVAIERAGALAGPDGVATASTLGYGGMLLGPPAIGFMAEWFTLPIALTSVAVLAGLAAVIGCTTRHR
ncbi:MFS transporter [Streptomyces sp. SID335]|nr:MFS transporter [Streptomyces sp. SID335]NDZ84313.1 MFS transporter [Streptomyces sp. SID10115]NEA06068.1 MFS transporter [Streptomyces sp. SID10116]NEB47433.1 MFS transporter [Streptomyces sp. SID339]